MKLSISVDDALYEAACESARPVLGDEARGSRLVQHALAALLARAAEPGYAAPPEDDAVTRDLDRHASRLLQEARHDFQSGWKEGVQQAGTLTWRELETLARCHWDYDQYADWEVARLKEELEGEDSEELENLCEWRDRERANTGTAHRAGFVSALRHVYTKVAHSRHGDDM